MNNEFKVELVRGTIDYYYGYEIRSSPIAVFVSNRNDTRMGTSLKFISLGAACSWIRDNLVYND